MGRENPYRGLTVWCLFTHALAWLLFTQTEAPEAVEKPHNILGSVIESVQDIVDRGGNGDFRKQPVEFAVGAQPSA